MPSISRKIFFVKLSVIFAAVIFSIIGFVGYSSNFEKVSAASSGPTPSFTGAPGESNCTACHGQFPVNSGTGNIVVSGIPANYRPGQQVPVTVTVNQVEGVLFGFQMTALDNIGRTAGTFTFPAANPQQLQLVNGFVDKFTRRYIQHTIDGISPTVFNTKSWNMTWTAPAQRVGKIGFYAAGNAANSDGQTSGDYIYTTAKAALSGSGISNFDADTSSDLSVFRPSAGTWFSLNSTNGNLQAVAFGASGDKIVPGDYDGDGKTDQAVWRPSNGVWYLQRSTAGFTAVSFGLPGDIPVAGDYDGDLKTDVAVFRPSNGVWYILQSSNGALDFKSFGLSTDKVAQGDYDADGKIDVAVWRPSSGTWFVLGTTAGFSATQFGASSDKPVQGDYDGDGKTDFAVFRPSNGVWYKLNSTEGFSAAQFGISSDKPVPADFDGDGKTDLAVYRSGTWFVLKSTDGSFYAAGFGLSDDVPVPSGYIAE